MKRPLSKRAAALVRAFDASAQAWGWQQDQGSGSGVRLAERHYAGDRAALERFIARLEARAKAR